MAVASPSSVCRRQTKPGEDSASALIRFIAEVSSNHHRDLARCFDFIDTAARIGCDAVKFQLFKIDQLFAPEILTKSATHRKRKDWELPLDFLPELAQHGHERGIQFSCTPFYLDAVDELKPFVDTLRTACGCPVGWSDHSVSPAVVHRAVQHWGAVAVEFHLDLDGQGEEFAAGHCWLPAQMQSVIETLQIGQTADGNGDEQPAPRRTSGS